MTSPSRPRRKAKLTPFTVDELLDNPAMSGFVSFLEVRPEQRTSLPQPVDSLPVSSSLPDGSLQPEGTLHPEGNLPPESSLPSVSNLPPPSGDLLPDSNLPSDGKVPPDGKVDADGTLPPGSTLLSNSTLPPGGTLPSGGTLLSGGKLRSGSDLLTENGRIVRIRQARTVQDAHTSAEHTLLQILWKEGTDETPRTRLIKAGLADVSHWTGAHKTSCRAYLRALIAKLAIEEAETFNASAGKEGARVYRVYSLDAILERRRNAGFTHVIRTGAVTFVDPATGSRLPPGSNLLPESDLPPRR